MRHFSPKFPLNFGLARRLAGLQREPTDSWVLLEVFRCSAPEPAQGTSPATPGAAKILEDFLREPADLRLLDGSRRHEIAP
jgi:hypothetical protein